MKRIRPVDTCLSIRSIRAYRSGRYVLIDPVDTCLSMRSIRAYRCDRYVLIRVPYKSMTNDDVPNANGANERRFNCYLPDTSFGVYLA
ncbi:hypothetical protein [Tannerella forsythia]|uniref:Uncharacterized protein n=1 Tax=Tannerella forsythia TaxID=28112 RepID=A0A3P1XKG1_TANFO|nr:hypothetical protein [Tannerella forsythia]RRD59264.1 hypothetical protein EII40_10725 [Tannerella forsythia]